MTNQFKDEIRSRMGTDKNLQQTVSAGLFGIADPDVFVNMVRNTYPRAIVGGVTAGGIEGAVLRVGTGQVAVFKDEIEGMLTELGEERVSQSAWGVEAKVWEDGDDQSASVTGQQVTVRVDGVQRLLSDISAEVEAEIVRQAVGRGWPPGANTPAFDRGVLGDVSVSAPEGEVTYRLGSPSIDASGLRALESFPRRAIVRIASADDPLGLPVDRRVDMEKTIRDDYKTREVEIRILP